MQNEQDSSKTSKQEGFNIFISNKIYPEAESIFTFRLKPISEIKDNCYIVIDTNALLVPYTVSPKSLDAIKQTFSELVTANRLVIPGQVAREFAKHRSTKISELYQQLSRNRNAQALPSIASYPLLQTMEDYTQAIDISQKIESLTKSYRDKLGTVLKNIREWVWNDPVSIIYQELFSKNVIFDMEINEQQMPDIDKEFMLRQAHNIPPGYKDKAKQDKGIGDYLIWKSILNIGENRKCNVIFVSGDEKADWWIQSENLHLYPRYELVDEFRRASEGGSFHMLEFHRFLELFGVSQEVVKEVKSEENQVRIGSRKTGYIVYKTMIPLYTDPHCKNSINNAWGVIIETRDISYNIAGYRRIYPTTQSHFKEGMKVAWEWDLRNTWERLYYCDPDTNEIRIAWDSSGEFIGKELSDWTVSYS